MSVGQSVRSVLGPLQRPAIRAYRSMFVSINDLGRQIATLGQPARVLEIGAGDGMVCEELAARFPDAEILGIDISATPGAMYQGPAGRVSFRQVSAEALLEEGGPLYDRVVVSDVLHHVPVGHRPDLLASAAALVAPHGYLVVKETCRDRSLGYAMSYVSDRYVSNDSGVAFMDQQELDSLLGAAVPGFTPGPRTTVRPWRLNVLLSLARPADPTG